MTLCIYLCVKIFTETFKQFVKTETAKSKGRKHYVNKINIITKLKLFEIWNFNLYIFCNSATRNLMVFNEIIEHTSSFIQEL